MMSTLGWRRSRQVTHDENEIDLDSDLCKWHLPVPKLGLMRCPRPLIVSNQYDAVTGLGFMPSISALRSNESIDKKLYPRLAVAHTS